MNATIMAALEGQKRRSAKIALDSAVKEVLDRHQDQAQDFAFEERSRVTKLISREEETVEVGRERNLGSPDPGFESWVETTKRRHIFARADAESKIDENKAEHDAKAQSEIKVLNQEYDLKFIKQLAPTPTSSKSSNAENTLSREITPNPVVSKAPTSSSSSPNATDQSKPQRNIYPGFGEDRRQSSTPSTFVGLTASLNSSTLSNDYYDNALSKTERNSLIGSDDEEIHTNLPTFLKTSSKYSTIGNGYYDNPFSKSDIGSLTVGGDEEVYTNLSHTLTKSGPSTPRSKKTISISQKQTPAVQTSKAPRVCTPVSTPSTAASKYCDVGNMPGDSSPLSMLSTPGFATTPTTAHTKTSGKRPRQQSSSPGSTVRKMSRAERAASRMVKKEKELKGKIGDKHTGDNVIFGISFIGYNPTEDPDDKTLELTWHRNLYMRLSDNAVIFEPHNGIHSCASEGQLLVLDQKWNKKAFFDSKSDRFEIYQRNGARLRIQFRTGQLERFIPQFNSYFDGILLSIVESPYLGEDEDFQSEGGASHPSHLV